MDDVSKGLTGIDRALAEALDVDPSPEFMARVRQRIADQPVPRSRWSGWRIAVPAAVAALLVVAAGIAIRSSRVSSPSRLAARALSIEVLRPAGAAPARVTSAVSAPARILVAPVARASAAASTEPEVLVPREEIEMYRRLIAAAQSVPSAIVVEMPKDIVAPGSFPEITIEPIKIELILPPVSGEGDRQ